MRRYPLPIKSSPHAKAAEVVFGQLDREKCGVISKSEVIDFANDKHFNERALADVRLLWPAAIQRSCPPFFFTHRYFRSPRVFFHTHIVQFFANDIRTHECVVRNNGEQALDVEGEEEVTKEVFVAKYENGELPEEVNQAIEGEVDRKIDYVGRLHDHTREFTEYCGSNLKGREFNLEYLIDEGRFSNPVLVNNDVAGLGMRVPDHPFTVEEVSTLIGPQQAVDVLNVADQSNGTMLLEEWQHYFRQTPSGQADGRTDAAASEAHYASKYDVATSGFEMCCACSTVGAGGKSRLGSSIKKFKCAFAHFIHTFLFFLGQRKQRLQREVCGGFGFQ